MTATTFEEIIWSLVSLVVLVVFVVSVLALLRHEHDHQLNVCVFEERMGHLSDPCRDFLTQERL